MDLTTDSTVPSTPAFVDIAITIEPSVAHVGDLRIVLAGELDCCSGPGLAHALAALRPPAHVPGQPHAQVVLDLHELSFLDSSGLRALEAGRKRLLDAGWLVTTGPAQRQVLMLLRFAEQSGWLTDGPLTCEGSPAA